ncbi:hypothetical protein ASPTUDRAFT_47980 [Aspergillus tubingensis CBS 134.48]|uniref:Uncharacterized protein n=1 Tax=Aspergillus tubingensis (strain CBS 134.48) TaxID=767770 RepID=A0A1L9MQP5_ASPTC|nr:hypothetical protein ASPTUDRAFT_47980 [Aspergillus tubingensis CBS 134.48]
MSLLRDDASLIIATVVRVLTLPLQKPYGSRTGEFGDQSQRRSGYLSKWGTDVRTRGKQLRWTRSEVLYH